MTVNFNRARSVSLQLAISAFFMLLYNYFDIGISLWYDYLEMESFILIINFLFHASYMCLLYL